MYEYKPHVDEFLNYCRYHKKLSEKTIRAYKIDLTQYKDFSDELSKQSIWNYIEHLNKLYKPKTAKRKLATLKAFIHFLLLKDLIDFNPFDKIETTIREPLLLPKTIPLDTIARLISFAYQKIVLAQTEYQMRCAVRNAAIIELLFATGARIAEVCNLHNEDVDLLGGSVKLFGKGSKERVIPIENYSVLSIMKRYRSLFESKIAKTGHFFVNKRGCRLTEQSVRSMINSYCTQCDIEQHITPHMFRHINHMKTSLLNHTHKNTIIPLQNHNKPHHNVMVRLVYIIFSFYLKYVIKQFHQPVLFTASGGAEPDIWDIFFKYMIFHLISLMLTCSVFVIIISIYLNRYHQ